MSALADASMWKCVVLQCLVAMSVVLQCVGGGQIPSPQWLAASFPVPLLQCVVVQYVVLQCVALQWVGGGTYQALSGSKHFFRIFDLHLNLLVFVRGSGKGVLARRLCLLHISRELCICELQWTGTYIFKHRKLCVYGNDEGVLAGRLGLLRVSHELCICIHIHGSCKVCIYVYRRHVYIAVDGYIYI